MESRHVVGVLRWAIPSRLVLVMSIGVVLVSGQRALADPSQYDVTTFGAIPNDGLPDDTAINNAIAAAQTSHGTVLFPSGTYNVSHLDDILTGYITIKGVGGRTNQSKICYAPTSNVPLFSLRAAGAIRISDIELDQCNGYGSLISNSGSAVDIEDCAFSGHSSNANPLVYSEKSSTMIRRNRMIVNNPAAYTIRMTCRTNCVALPTANVNSAITDNELGGIGKGILVDKDSASTPGQVEGLTISRNVVITTGGDLVFVTAVLHLNVTDNILDQSSYAGVHFSPSKGGIDSVVVTGNYFGFNSSNGGQIGILSDNVANGASNVTIGSNRFYNGLYGIIVRAKDSRWNITNNAMSGNTGQNGVGILLQSSTGYINIIGNIVSGYSVSWQNSGSANINVSSNFF